MGVRFFRLVAWVAIGTAMAGWVPAISAQDAACRADDLPTRHGSASADALLDRSMLALWKGLDTTADDYIDEREAAVEPQLFACFSVLDVNSDSRLDASEFARFRYIRSDSLAGELR